MSKRFVILSIVIAAALALGYYFARTRPAPSPTATSEPQGTAPEQPNPPQQSNPPQPSPSPQARFDEILDGIKHPVPSNPYPVTVSLGGEQIPVRSRDSGYSRVAPKDIDDGKSGGFFAPLADAARAGNDDAAYALYKSLKLCQHAPRTQTDFEAAKAHLAKWFAETGGVQAPGQEPDSLDSLSKDLEAGFHRCDGVTDDTYATTTDLLRESAERGADDIRALYAQAIASSDPKTAREQYKILWQRGYVEGLKDLATDSLPHRIAYVAAMSAMFNSPDAMKAIQNAMSPNAFEQASKEAAQILKNPNCCKF